MAPNFTTALFKCVLTAIALFQVSFIVVQCKVCSSGDFGSLLLQCNENKTRSIVPFMRKQCDPTSVGAYFPKIIKGLPCECKPGRGIKIVTKPNFSWLCAKCKAGNYSVGGMVIDTWERWNGSLNVPGSGYRFTPFCVSVVKGGLCDGWQPSNDFSHLVSSSYLNKTNPASCLEQKNMQTYMAFYNKDEGGNYISFRYKLDGMPCPKTTLDCRKGLTFYVDDKVVLKSDVQFTWRVFKYNLTAGTHVFRWTHVSSCSNRVGYLDVAYVTHVAFVGVSKAHTMCNECPVGTFSSEDGSQECTKCPYGQYQNKTGQTKCLKCPAGTFSHFGDKNCFKLNKCSKSDYRLVPDPISKCYLKDGKPVRNQLVLTPKWPGMDSGPCTHEDKPDTTTNCTCPPGFSLKPVYKTDGSKDSYECKPCPDGQTMTKSGKCGKCPDGKAAIPGIFYMEWPNGGIPKEFKTECSGNGCSDGGWLPSGDSIATQRIPGNFETYIELRNLNIKYHRSFVTFNCSVDCRINPVQNKLARANDCFLRFSLIRDGKVNVREVDCIKYSRHHQRNGTKMSHYYSISRPGNYTFRWLFHQNDDESTNVLSYEARVHNIRIWGVEKGQAKECISCSAGSEVSKDGTSCEKCPVGTYSPKGIKCERCPQDTFTDKVESSKCIPCGANTTSNEARTDCLVNNCQFAAAPGVIYNLMPMANVNGSMVEVKQYPKRGSHIWYRNYFYVNLCTRDHDNSSCTDLQNRADETGRYVKETVILKTMACKRWSFSSKYSYSIGRVIGFKSKKDVASGLTVELTDGYNCYNKHSFKMIPAKTIIDMICDIDAGIGVPMPIDNKTAVEMKPCEFHLVWRSLYACPICQDSKGKEMHTECINGLKNVTYTPAVNCRDTTKGHTSITKYNIKCKAAKYSVVIPKAVSHIGLAVVIVIFTLLAIGLIITVIMLLRKNRLYRTQLFSPGTHMKALQEDDLHELIDD